LQKLKTLPFAILAGTGYLVANLTLTFQGLSIVEGFMNDRGLPLSEAMQVPAEDVMHIGKISAHKEECNAKTA
jgi:uncharacterized protein YjaZ